MAASQNGETAEGFKPMTAETMYDHVAKLSVETADQLTKRDIHELCDADRKSVV